MIDVFIGFMDEEVFYTIQQLIAGNGAKQYGRVYAIERDVIEGKGRLFERPLSAYGPAVTIFNPAIPDAGMKDRDPILDELMRGIRRVFNDGFPEDKLIGHETGADSKTNIRSPRFSVIDFGKRDGPRDSTAIVIRAPEMGREPSLFRPYIRALLKAMQGLGAINLFSLGAGGACSDDGKPGDIHVIGASIFTGPNIEDANAYSVIAFAGDQYSLQIYRNLQGRVTVEDRFAAVRAAEADAGSQLEDLSILDAFARQRAFVKDLVAQRSGGHKASLTTAAIGGKEMKEAGNRLGLKDVNTEDYHILRIVQGVQAKAESAEGAREYPLIETSAVLRIDSDPYSIPDSDVAALNKWKLANGVMPIADAANVIEFGLGGLLVETKPRFVQWNYPGILYEEEGDGEEQAQFNAARFIGVDPGFFLDPFRMEIASDLLPAAVRRSALPPAREGTPDAALADSLAAMAGLILSSGSASGADSGLLALRDNDIFGPAARDALAVLDDARRNRRLMIERFLGLLAAKLWQIWDEDVKIQIPKATNIPVWVRRGKWSDGPKKDTVLLTAVEFTGPATDRAYYRSSNFPALMRLNQTVFLDSIHNYVASH